MKKTLPVLAVSIPAILSDPKLRTKPDDHCISVGECMPCAKSEANENYCRGTGYKQELICMKGALNITIYEFCLPPTTNQGLTNVLTFESLMLVILLFASILLQKEKKKHLSSFDLRKDPRQPSKPFQT
ncbi:hypothetical protein THRCLA_21893 [Thraustotheca clavata]|uniref:Uncharacterized protein n=1 Tax=Thraustotheca clavata TaxID=74557 RepID=A0A1V9ZK42_9STRA|nr:hypothetical protein THRCLA_21893 [Thraustotheca clavata]